MNSRLVTAVAIAAVACGGYVNAQTTAASSPKPAAAATAKHPAEATLSLKNLPPAVRATVEAETKHAVLKRVGREKEHGKTVYEVESLVNGRTRDLMVDSAGKVYEVEEQLDLDQAPAPVRSAIDAKGRVLALEKVTTNGTVHYEGHVRTKTGKKAAFDLDANGQPVKQ